MKNKIKNFTLSLFIALIMSCLGIFGIVDTTMANCNYTGDGDVLSAIDGCISGVDGLIEAGSSTDVGGNIDDLKSKIIDWNTTLAGFFLLIAVAALIYGAFQLVFSTGEDEKVSAAKKTIKWAIIGVIAILLAAGIVRILITLIYNYAG